jgi:Ca-activated chloride channel family protein
MHFLSPGWLLLLFVVLLLAVAYVWVQLRKPRHAVRFTNLDLLDNVAPSRPGARRHLVAALLGVSLVLLVVAMAQPYRTVQIPNEMSTVVLAFDTSLSMEATDVDPSRLEAAQDSAIEFVAGVPEELELGLVTFDAGASTAVPPGEDHQAVVDELEDVRLGPGTAIGDAIVTSVEAIEDAIADAEASQGDGSDQDTGDDEASEEDGDQAPPGAIVLLSDGTPDGDTVPLEEAIETAQEAGIPVSTIAFGTEDGTITDPLTGDELEVAVDEETLQDIADQTGGTAFDADSAEELDAVYADIGATVDYEEEDRDISRWFLGAGLITLVVCAGLSLVWSSRIL